MVKPSPKLTLKQSSRVLQFFQSFQQPPPFGPKESQKLLAQITNSFRQTLDKEHGEFRKDNLFFSPMKNTSSTTPASNVSRRRSFSEPIPPTDRHFSAILSDPLFITRNELARTKRNSSNNPMKVFELAVARGLMTMDKCRDCLSAEKKLILQSPKLSIMQGMADSGAGLKVLKWLKASGLADTGQYLIQHGLFAILAEFMVAEGLQEALWSDFTKLFASLDSSFQASSPAMKALLHMVKAELKGPNNLHAGVAVLVRASSLLQHYPDFVQRLILRPSTCMVTYHCTVLSHTYAKPTPSSLADLVAIVHKFLKPTNLYIAHLQLHHSTPQPALDFFKELPEELNKNSQQYPARPTISLGLDAAKYLLEHGRVKEARSIMNVLQSSFPDQLGIRGNQALRHAKSEAWNLELLQGMSFA